MGFSSRTLIFEPFRLDVLEERFWRGSEALTLRRKAFALLRYLAENPRRLVTQEEIIKSVWDGAAVSESLVRGCIRELRQVLGDGYLETVVGRGYRFVAPVTANTGPAPGASIAQRPYPPGVDDPAPKAPPARSPPGLCGRQTELASLDARLASALAGERQLVFVSGEAGIGKSALLDAFLERAASSAIVARGQCVEQFGSGEAYLPVVQALSSLCRGPHGDRSTALLSRYAPTWLWQMPGLITDDQIDAIQRRVGAASQARMLRELGEALEALTIERPVVLAFEDLHWSDHSTADVLALLGQRRDPARLLVVGTSRPAELLTPTHPLNKIVRELSARGYAEHTHLAALDEDGMTQYLAARFPRNQFAVGLAQAVHSITGGRPLFAVAVCADLEAKRLVIEEDGHWRLRAPLEDVSRHRPESMTQLIDIQMDRLSPAEQRVLEAGCVVGLEFSVALVAAALDDKEEDVEDLCQGLARRRCFLRHAGTEEWPDGTTWTRFGLVHALFQHVAANRSTPARRQLWHRRIAARLEAAYGSRGDEIAADLAAHFERGGDHERAADYYALAAERASKRCVSTEAIDQLRRALSLLEKLPATPQRDRTELRLLSALEPLVLAQPNIEVDHSALCARAVELAGGVGTQGELAQALADLQIAHILRAQLVEAEDAGRRLGSLADSSEDRTTRLVTDLRSASIAYWRGDLSTARELFEEVARGYEREAITGSALDCAGRAVDRLYELSRLSRQREVVLSRLLPPLAELCYRFDRVDQALACIAEARELARSRGFKVWLPEFLRLRGEILRRSSVADAERGLLEALELAQECRAKSLELRIATSLCHLWQGSNKQARGFALLAETVAFFADGFETIDLEHAKALLQR